MDLTHRLFGIRSCRETLDGHRHRPCLEFDIKRCVAPCVETICSLERYGRAVEHARLFLEGRNDELLDDLARQMAQAAAAERFEQAAQLRDAIRTVETLRDRKQKMATPALGDRDAFGVKVGGGGATVHVFQMRGGRVIDRVELWSEAGTAAGSEADVLEAAVQQFYDQQPPPAEIHVPVAPGDLEWLEEWLAAKAGRKVRIVVPRRGEKRALLDLAMRNAALACDARFNETGTAQYDALDSLRATFALPRLPRRIDCFDISTIQGSETVASMVVCEHGRMRRSEYRKFRVRGEGGEPPGPHGRGPDDFAAMEEVVARRYRKVAEEDGPWPDLLLIDGGKGQLTAAYAALASLDLDHLVAIGIAKKEELIFTRDRDGPVAFPRESPALRLLQRIRDEAHRFAVTYHRRARAMRDFGSELDVVPGVGPRRRKALLTRFGSLAGVRRASPEELESVVGARVAAALRQWLDGAPR
jgi:excinuclease ABC subunit C